MEKKYTIEEIRDMLINFGKEYTLTENGAITPLSSGSKLVDQFGKVASFRNRNLSDVFSDMEEIWNENPDMSLKFIFYLRMITRVVILPNTKETENVQKGQGCKDEAFKRFIWLAVNHKDIFFRNLHMIPIIGSWKDLWVLMTMMYDYGFDINRQIFYTLMASAMKVESQIDLIKKFMPRIKTKSNIKTPKGEVLNTFTKEFANFLGMTSRQYNKFKSNGKAHEFQRFMCAREFDKLEWNKIPGIALGKLVSKDFIKRHELTQNYIDWLSKQKTIKFNGYPYDLLVRIKKATNSNIHVLLSSSYWGNRITIPEILQHTTDLQFDNLIATSQRDGKITENVLCALDTSGSMASGSGDVTPLDVCLSLGLYFSTLTQGHFHKKVVMFDNTSTMQQLTGSFCEMLRQIPINAWGGTNFMSVINLLVEYRRNNPTIPLEEYPTTLLIVSDMQFNPIGKNVETNYKATKRELLKAFPKEFVDKMKFIWWNVNGKHEGMPATMDDGGCYFFSGFDGAIASLLLGKEQQDKKPSKTMEEVLTEALTQEVLLYVK